MIPMLIFLWNFFRHDYAKALAYLKSGSKRNISLQQYALYRLGMYKSASAFEPIKNSNYSLFSFIVSRAACADYKSIDKILQDKNILKKLNSKKIQLATSLLPFYPELSSRLLPENSSFALQAAVWLKLENQEKAIACLSSAMKFSDPNPEINLLRINALELSIEENVDILNDFLKKYQIAPLDLINKKLPIGPMNLRSKNISLSVSGPLVSVIMTTFRNFHRIQFSIESLLNQTYQNIEIIIIDDASDDDTEKIIKRIMQKEIRLKYVKLPINIGTYAAKSIGLKLSKGEFITCHDSDDWAHPQKIELQMLPLIKDKKIIFSISNLVRIQDNGSFYARAVYPLIRINPSSVLFRKSVVGERTGFWDLVRTGADSEFLARLKIVFGKHGMQRVNKPLSFCAHRPESLMTSSITGYDDSGISNMRLEYWEAFAKWHIDELKKKKIPYLSNELIGVRNFDAPVENLVDVESILICMKACGLNKL